VSVRQRIYLAYHSARGGNLAARYAAVRRDDELGTGADHRAERLALVLQHARRHVPYYRRLLGCGDLTDPWSRLGELPPLTKQMIREDPTAFRSDDLAARPWYHNHSGGSTGEPVTVVQDRDFWEWWIAVQMLHSNWARHTLGEPQISLWGSEEDILRTRTSVSQTVANLITRRRTINAYRMTPAAIERFVRELNTGRYTLIVAYAQALFEVAGHIERHGLVVAPQRAIVTTAETLYPKMRARIERVFACPVLDRYGSREVGDIAGQCGRRMGLHVFPWVNHVEIVDDEGRAVPPGVEGNILVTSLVNLAMPMIRYAIGDRGVLAPDGQGCSCGRPGQVLERVIGRSSQLFRRRDGTLVDPGYFMTVLDVLPAIRRFQVLQRDYDDILIRLDRDTAPASTELDHIARDVRAAMGADCRVRFEFPERISPTGSGKFLYTMSDLSPRD
jgi:phenylacetate-CoA ligase